MKNDNASKYNDFNFNFFNYFGLNAVFLCRFNEEPIVLTLYSGHFGLNYIKGFNKHRQIQ